MDPGHDPLQGESDRIRDLIGDQPAVGGVAAGLESVLGRLCRAVVEDLELSGATVTLLPSADMHLVAAASDEAARTIEQLQFDVAEGPTVEASQRSIPVLVPDLMGQGLVRWPGFVTAAAAVNVGAAFAFPLQLGASRFGTMTLYRTGVGGLGTAALRAALIYADIAVERLIDGSLPPGYPGSVAREAPARDLLGPSDVEAPDMDYALDAQSRIYQAQGMVMVQLGVSLAEALARMRAHAYGQGLSLAILATEIVQGTIKLSKADEQP